MEKYERNVGLKTIWLTFVRRYDVIVFIFVPVLLVSALVTQVILKKQYYSEVVVSKSTIITNEQYQNIQTAASKSSTASKVYTSLKEKGLKHKDGSEISAAEIQSGVSFPKYTSNSISASFVFNSSDKTITKFVLDEIATTAVDELKTKTYFSDLTILKSASNPVVDKKNMKYFLIASGAGLLLSLAAAFVYEIVTDKVYSRNDVEFYDYTAIDISVPKIKEVKKDEK